MAQLAVTVSRVGAAVTAWKALPASTVGTAEPGRPEHGGRRKSAGAAWQAGVPLASFTSTDTAGRRTTCSEPECTCTCETTGLGGL
jgi:hypothetical protein